MCFNFKADQNVQSQHQQHNQRQLHAAVHVSNVEQFQGPIECADRQFNLPGNLIESLEIIYKLD